MSLKLLTAVPMNLQVVVCLEEVVALLKDQVVVCLEEVEEESLEAVVALPNNQH